MKKNAFVSIILAAATAAVMTVGAAAMKPVGSLSLAYGKSTVDGKYDASEWRSATKITFDSTTAKPWSGSIQSSWSSEIKAMWDETALYIGGSITDATLKASTAGKYDGDGMQFSIDLGQHLQGSSESRAIFYSIGYWESGVTGMVQRQESKKDAVINDGAGVSVKTVKDAQGFDFEIALPWSMLVEDNKLKSGKTFEVKAGSKLNMMLCYMDKDTAGKLLAAFGTTLTDESVKYDWGPNDHGITLTLAAKPTAKPASAAATADLGSALVLALAASGLAVLCAKKH